jgi:hypothetical protein
VAAGDAAFHHRAQRRGGDGDAVFAGGGRGLVEVGVDRDASGAQDDRRFHGRIPVRSRERSRRAPVSHVGNLSNRSGRLEPGKYDSFHLNRDAIGVYMPSVPRKLLTVAETPLFVRQAEAVWSEPEREAFVDFIAANPETGDVIPETGGVRKVRWARAGTGKRGGARVIYFYHNADHPLYLLMVYAKALQENLSPEEKKTVRRLAAILKG